MAVYIGFVDGVFVGLLAGLIVILFLIVSGRYNDKVFLGGVVFSAGMAVVMFEEYFVFRVIFYGCSFVLYCVEYWVSIVIVVGLVWRIIEMKAEQKLYKL